MTDPRIEAAAKALWDHGRIPGAWAWPDINDEAREHFTERATFAIAAIDKASTINTVEQLDALPELTVLIDSDPDVIEKHGNRWRSMNESGEFYSSIRIGLPARVIHWGTE